MRTNRIAPLDGANARATTVSTIQGWADRVAAGFPPLGPTVADHLVGLLDLDHSVQRTDRIHDDSPTNAA